MEWDGDAVIFGGTRFRVGFGPGHKTGPQELFMMKPRALVERYVELIDALRPRRIVELGIFFGGSVAFLTLLAKPERYVATDISLAASPRFEAWLASHDEVRPYYGVDQADAAALRNIVSQEFARTPLDLVIDDASHLLGPTRASFNVLFPLLRPGGVYVVEDWATDHEWERHTTQDPAVADAILRELAKRVPLTRLLFEIVLASAYTDLVEAIEIRPHWLAVTKGPEQPDPEDFDIARCHMSLGRRLLRDEPGSISS